MEDVFNNFHTNAHQNEGIKKIPQEQWDYLQHKNKVTLSLYSLSPETIYNHIYFQKIMGTIIFSFEPFTSVRY